MSTSTGLLLVIVGVSLTVCDAYLICNELNECEDEAKGGILRASIRCYTPTVYKYIRIANDSPPEERCSYYINPHSDRVRQLRIDFKLRMVPPATKSQSLVGASCQVDFVKIGNFRLCGREEQQHFYIPYDGSVKSEFLVKVNTGRRRQHGYPPPQWELNITQVELLQNCQQPLVHQFTDSSAHCDPFLAPPPCMQYFTEPKGIVSSFNFDKGRGFYLPKDYVICFKKPHASAVLRLNVTHFKLAYRGNPPTEMTSKYCPLCERDYMVIYGKITGGTLLTKISPQELNDHVNYFSGRILENSTLDVSKQGIPVLQFQTGGQNTQHNSGFQFNYEFI